MNGIWKKEIEEKKIYFNISTPDVIVSGWQKTSKIKRKWISFKETD